VSPAAAMISINCLVLGDDLSCIFEIQIASTATVSALKDVIKEKRQPAFNTVVASHLQLWRVSDLMPTIGCWRSDILEAHPA